MPLYFIDAVIWIARNGAPGERCLNPVGSGPVCINFMRWSKAGVWPMIFNTLAADADMEWVMIDSTLVRAHPHAASAKVFRWVARTRAGEDRQAVSLPRSAGGFTTKIHAACDALGHPIKFILTGGQCSDDTKAIDLIEGFESQKLLADKGYDATYIVKYVGIDKAAIPSRSMRINSRDYDLRTLQRTKPCGADV